MRRPARTRPAKPYAGSETALTDRRPSHCDGRASAESCGEGRCFRYFRERELCLTGLRWACRERGLTSLIDTHCCTLLLYIRSAPRARRTNMLLTRAF